MYKGNSFRIEQQTTLTSRNMFILLDEIRRFVDLGPHSQEKCSTSSEDEKKSEKIKRTIEFDFHLLGSDK
jgi:hypothetical protein